MATFFDFVSPRRVFAAIADYIAFLPPSPTYEIVSNDAKLLKMSFKDVAMWQYGEREKNLLDVSFTKTSSGNDIVCLFVSSAANAKYTILFSHGNAVDLGQTASFFVRLANRLNCNVFSYDYSGYGASKGKPSEKNLYSDLDAAWDALRTKYHVQEESVILYGRSLGTVPTIDLATRLHKIPGVILQSPLASALRMLLPSMSSTWSIDSFPSVDKAPRITAPVLVIHGTKDEVINFSHGQMVYDRCKNKLAPLWVQGAGHNDMEAFQEFWERLEEFVDSDLGDEDKGMLQDRAFIPGIRVYKWHVPCIHEELCGCHVRSQSVVQRGLQVQHGILFSLQFSEDPVQESLVSA
ncbi:unnamed protein product [Darwinula stevensoni]|uniref:Serine aminopeptidase S33 domain-containing protein n=1 Tax=Darwinula stevensoni TaxID=69355 RepID=A0A7R8X4B8_9CRUS|nr:unnamed protein product [Darwinula stevensoni]CAG0883320.1 unnamed protein product [Darwinula stevensoni]